ncbi:MAG: hypothetical protein IB618_02155 [Candidatus Pacearchaeota archaeon]|nr:MAG: hypothetical protein IB618_02155 [Candidatus Pacearchaeota archaeon]
MQKRGQVTLFIIIAIVIVALIVLVIFFQRGFPGVELSENDVATVKSYLGECFELKTKEGILFLGKQAGYYNLEGVESINFLDEQTAYYWKAEQSLVPSVDIVANELDKYLDDNINDCFTLEDYDIMSEECSINSQITENVDVLFDCPITIKKGMATARLESFTTSVEAPVVKLLDVSDQVVEDYEKKPGSLCVACIDEIATVNNVTIKAVPITKDIFEPEHIWFLITDKDIKFDDKNITWRFVVEI